MLMDASIVPLAYKFVATAAMLGEINYCASNLNLPCELPITRDSLRVAYLARPVLSGFGAALETETWSFIFSGSGKLRYISRNRNRFSEMSRPELEREISGTNASMSTAEALILAT